MIKSYLAQLELRIEAVSKLLGDTSDFKESDVKDVKEGINEVVSKLHKDNSRKCNDLLMQSKESKRPSKNTIRL